MHSMMRNLLQSQEMANGKIAELELRLKLAADTDSQHRQRILEAEAFAAELERELSERLSQADELSAGLEAARQEAAELRRELGAVKGKSMEYHEVRDQVHTRSSSPGVPRCCLLHPTARWSCVAAIGGECQVK